MKNNIFFLFIFLFTIFYSGCSCSNEFKKTPVDELIQKYEKEKTYSIILEDLDVDGTFSKDYKQKYKIVTDDANGNPKEEVTDWKNVSEEFFMAHQNDMGMELVSKDSTGKIHKEVAPAGFTNYVGNTRYGSWVQRDGGSFWEFYGKYAMMSSMFRMLTPYNYNHYNDYYSNYRTYGKPYYGNYNGRSTFGTFGSNTQASRPSNFQDKLNRIKTSSSSFNERVNSKVTRSTGRTSSTPSSSSRGRSGSSGK